ncbi:hypothetical protein ABB55_06325 [Prosthecomicrobium hirschii]|uniref:Uncharacterized protein n=1 Tax=Prosthecodimorpha hirschii TaxID=665126 RepID=A0A0P6W172_9HYPH|nr:hypothetical protein ABB55_06325 [Prosthecomicrobium hirschii]
MREPGVGAAAGHHDGCGQVAGLVAGHRDVQVQGNRLRAYRYRHLTIIYEHTVEAESNDERRRPVGRGSEDADRGTAPNGGDRMLLLVRDTERAGLYCYHRDESD